MTAREREWAPRSIRVSLFAIRVDFNQLWAFCRISTCRGKLSAKREKHITINIHSLSNFHEKCARSKHAHPLTSIVWSSKKLFWWVCRHFRNVSNTLQNFVILFDEHIHCWNCTRELWNVTPYTRCVFSYFISNSSQPFNWNTPMPVRCSGMRSYIIYEIQWGIISYFASLTEIKKQMKRNQE